MSKLAAIMLTVSLACGGTAGKGAGTPTTATPAPTPTAPTSSTPTPNSTPNSTPAATPTDTTTPPADPCAGLMPAAPLAAAIEHVEPFSSFPWYAAGTSDGDGDFVATLDGYKCHDYAFYPADGSDRPAGTLQTEPALAPQPHGYQALHIASGMPTPTLIVSDGKGQLVASVPFTHGAAYAIASDPGGGSAVLTEDFPTGSGQWLERFDGDGHSSGSVSLDAIGALVGVAKEGAALVTAGAQARWFDRHASPLTDWFAAEAAATGVDLTPLADGALAARDRNRAWVGIFRPGAASAEAAPTWLAGQHDRNAWVVRGGKAMAFAPVATSQPACGSGCGKFELVTADGHSCGTFELPGGSDEPVNVGKDGTAFALTYDGFTTVHWRWWSKLLK